MSQDPDDNRGDAPPRLTPKGWQIGLDEGEKAYTVAQKVLEDIRHRGIKLSARPGIESSFVDEDGYPIMPPNLMQLTDEELGELYSIVDAWKTYVSDQVAEVIVHWSEAQKQFEFISSKVRLTKDGKQKDKDDAKLTDVRYVNASAKVLELQCLMTMMQRSENNLETNRRTISRIITLRDQEIRSGARMAGLSSRRAFSSRDVEATSFPRPALRPANPDLSKKTDPAKTDPPAKERKRRPPQRPKVG